MEAQRMYAYRNKNTGDVVEYEYPSPRLEMLPNWETLQEPEANEPQDPPASIVTDPPTEPQGPTIPVVMVPVGPADPGDNPPGEPGAGGDGSGPDAIERPARSASKADWVVYARTRAQDSDEEAAIGDLTKDQLIEQYGGDSR